MAALRQRRLYIDQHSSNMQSENGESAKSQHATRKRRVNKVATDSHENGETKK
jgi:hypothetical protein